MMRVASNMGIECAKMGVTTVDTDHNKTEKIKTVRPPYFGAAHAPKICKNLKLIQYDELVSRKTNLACEIPKRKR